MAFYLPKALALGLAGAATLALGGCYDDGYGYGGVEAGAGYDGGGYGYDGYDSYYAGGYGYGGYGYSGFGDPGYGWFDGFYYPGTGFYVYDRGGHRRRMRDNDRQHWHGGGRGRDRQAGGWQGRGARDPGRAGTLTGGGQGSESAPPPPGAPRPGQGAWQGGRAGYRGDAAAGRWQARGGQRGVVSQGMRSPPSSLRGAGGTGRRRGGN